MARNRALYFSLAEKFMGTKTQVTQWTLQKIKKGFPLGVDDPVLRLTSSCVAYEIWDELPITVIFPKLVKPGESRYITLNEYHWVAYPGNALRSVWRPATEAELFWINSNTRRHLPSDFAFFGGRLYAHILTHFDDLNSMMRQLLRHIPATYIGDRENLQGQILATPGDLDLIHGLESGIKGAIAHLRKRGVPTTDRKAMAKQEVIKVADRLQGKTRIPLILANEAISQALKTEDPDEVFRHLLEAESRLVEEELHQGKIVMNVLESARSTVKMYRIRIQAGVSGAFRSLNKLLSDTRQLEGLNTAQLATQGRCLNSLIERSENLWGRFLLVAPFEPMRGIIVSSEGRGIWRAAEHLRQQRIPTSINNLNRARKHLQQLVIGDKPQAGEITRQRRRAGRKYQ